MDVGLWSTDNSCCCSQIWLREETLLTKLSWNKQAQSTQSADSHVTQYWWILILCCPEVVCPLSEIWVDDNICFVWYADSVCADTGLRWIPLAKY